MVVLPETTNLDEAVDRAGRGRAREVRKGLARTCGLGLPATTPHSGRLVEGRLPQRLDWLAYAMKQLGVFYGPKKTLLNINIYREFIERFGLFWNRRDNANKCLPFMIAGHSSLSLK